MSGLVLVSVEFGGVMLFKGFVVWAAELDQRPPHMRTLLNFRVRFWFAHRFGVRSQNSGSYRRS